MSASIQVQTYQKQTVVHPGFGQGLSEARLQILKNNFYLGVKRCNLGLQDSLGPQIVLGGGHGTPSPNLVDICTWISALIYNVWMLRMSHLYEFMLLKCNWLKRECSNHGETLTDSAIVATCIPLHYVCCLRSGQCDNTVKGELPAWIKDKFTLSQLQRCLQLNILSKWCAGSIVVIFT